MNTSLRSPRILAVDDDELWLEQIPIILRGLADVVTISSVDEALNLLEDQCFDVVLLDLNFKYEIRSGLDIFRQILALNSGTDVVVISGETNPLRLIEVFNTGITRFIPKPADIDAIRLEVGRVLAERKTRLEALESLNQFSRQRNPLIGRSPAITRLRAQVEELLRIGFKDLMIGGDSGTGKEVLARFLATQISPGSRFIPLHCGAISEGLAESELFGHMKGSFTGADKDRVGIFESAAGGFVFLDEIGEMPMPQQAKLLRVIQERKVQRVGSFEERPATFRTISATHVNLDEAVQAKRFREDLYFRLSKEKLHIPAVRERKEDIPALIGSFELKNMKSEAVEFSPQAMDLLVNYDWPGNIRQLSAITEGIAARLESKVVRERDVYSILPEVLRQSVPGVARGALLSYSNAVIASQRKKFEKALIDAKGNRVEAMKILGMSKSAYYRQAKELGLTRFKIPRLTK
ncbi:MAG: sigma-54-dependent Fis family transcriptional regulator [Bdellovibrionales bacterium]|nr:sigma-54-dependent Fis family transcriptional regulator [Bdellovibrionales bacterium]